MREDDREIKEIDDEKIVISAFRSEVNTILFPLFIFNSRSGESSIEYSGIVVEEGRVVKFKWQVSAHSSYGLPTPFDWQVFRAIEDLISEMPKPVENPVKFSFRELCERMGVNFNGRICKKIRESIERLTFTGIHSEKAFFLKEKRERITKAGFHLYDMFVFVNDRLPDGTIAETNYLWLNPLYLSNINHNYVKPFDKEFYWSLEKPISRRLYEILSIKFYGMSDLGATLYQNYVRLCELIRITPQRHLSWARKVLDPAHDELINTGFLGSVEWEKRGKRPERWFILYTPGPRAIAEIRRAKGEKIQLPPPELSDEQEMAALALQERGVIPKVARQLVQEYDLEKIWAVIEYIDWYRKQPNKVQNWGAYIAELIRDPDFSVPPEFKKAVEREKERKRREELERKAREILEERIEEALKNWSDERIIQEKLEKALKARDVLVKAGMARPYTPEEIEELRREIERSLPKTEEERRRWLIFNGGERFNLESIMREIEEAFGEERRSGMDEIR